MASPEPQCNVYVANLPHTMNSKQLLEFFSRYGRVVHANVLRDIASGQSRGVGFVMFLESRDALAVCSKNAVECGDSYLDVRLANHNMPNSKYVISPTVFVRNIPGNVASPVVQQYFQQYGRCHVEPHQESCECGGPSPFNMDFVTFDNDRTAERVAMEVDGTSPFTPSGVDHPLLLAKMVADVAGERRKSIIIQDRRPRRSRTSVSGSPTFANPNISQPASPSMAPNNARLLYAPFATSIAAPPQAPYVGNPTFTTAAAEQSYGSLSGIMVYLPNMPQPPQTRTPSIIVLPPNTQFINPN